VAGDRALTQTNRLLGVAGELLEIAGSGATPRRCSISRRRPRCGPIRVHRTRRRPSHPWGARIRIRGASTSNTQAIRDSTRSCPTLAFRDGHDLTGVGDVRRFRAWLDTRDEATKKSSAENRVSGRGRIASTRRFGLMPVKPRRNRNGGPPATSGIGRADGRCGAADQGRRTKPGGQPGQLRRDDSHNTMTRLNFRWHRRACGCPRLREMNRGQLAGAAGTPGPTSGPGTMTVLHHGADAIGAARVAAWSVRRRVFPRPRMELAPTATDVLAQRPMTGERDIPVRGTGNAIDDDRYARPPPKR